MFNFVALCPKRWFQFNSNIVRTHFSSIMSLNNSKMIAETRSHIFRWRSRFRRRRVCLSSLILSATRAWVFQLQLLILNLLMFRGRFKKKNTWGQKKIQLSGGQKALLVYAENENRKFCYLLLKKSCKGEKRWRGHVTAAALLSS